LIRYGYNGRDVVDPVKKFDDEPTPFISYKDFQRVLRMKEEHPDSEIGKLLDFLDRNGYIFVGSKLFSDLCEWRKSH
jgi:hypothetical protein